MPSFTEHLQVNGEDMEMYTSVPSGAGPFPAVVVAFHVDGLDEFDRVMADRLAEAGYVAVVPDMFHRFTPEIWEGPRLDRLKHLSDPEIIDDINAAIGFLQAHSSVDSNRLGITGFCMGGRVTWLMAAVSSVFKAAVPYYGGSIMNIWGAGSQSPFDLSSGIDCPMMFHFGQEDGNPSPDDQVKLDEELTRLGKPHEFFSYPVAGHAFMDHTGQRYNKEAAETSWPRTLDFFAQHLK